jgi:hypothetical protein
MIIPFCRFFKFGKTYNKENQGDPLMEEYQDQAQAQRQAQLCDIGKKVKSRANRNFALTTCLTVGMSLFVLAFFFVETYFGSRSYYVVAILAAVFLFFDVESILRNNKMRAEILKSSDEKVGLSYAIKDPRVKGYHRTQRRNQLAITIILGVLFAGLGTSLFVASYLSTPRDFSALTEKTGYFEKMNKTSSGTLYLTLKDDTDVYEIDGKYSSAFNATEFTTTVDKSTPLTLKYAPKENDTYQPTYYVRQGEVTYLSEDEVNTIDKADRQMGMILGYVTWGLSAINLLAIPVILVQAKKGMAQETIDLSSLPEDIKAASPTPMQATLNPQSVHIHVECPKTIRIILDVCGGLSIVAGILVAIFVTHPDGRWVGLALLAFFGILLIILGLTLRTYVDLAGETLTYYSGASKPKTFAVKDIANLRLGTNGAIAFFDGSGKQLGSMILSKINHSMELVQYLMSLGIPCYGPQ